MSMFIIVPLAVAERLCGERRYAPAAKTEHEAKLDVKNRALWGLYAMPLVGRTERAIPIDVLKHPAYAEAVAELSTYPQEDLSDSAFPAPPPMFP